MKARPESPGRQVLGGIAVHRTARWWMHVMAVGLLVAQTQSGLLAGIGLHGFFDEYLVLGPYANPDGAGVSEARQQADFLCDGVTSEGTIEPSDGLQLGDPLTGGCAASRSRYLRAGLPTIRAVSSSGDLLDLMPLGENVNTLAYAWVYIENLTDTNDSFTLAFAADDGVQVKLNGEEIFNIAGAIYYEAPETILYRTPLYLPPGGSLLQFKVFQGGGVWGLRARLEEGGTQVPILRGGRSDKPEGPGSSSPRPPHGVRVAGRFPVLPRSPPGGAIVIDGSISGLAGIPGQPADAPPRAPRWR